MPFQFNITIAVLVIFNRLFVLPAAMAPDPIFGFFFDYLFESPDVFFCYHFFGKPFCVVKKKFYIKIVITPFYFLNMEKDYCHIIL